MTRLSVNVNKIAVLRNSRGGALPSVVEAADCAVAAGAQGITVHPRPDCRHIRPEDAFDLANRYPVEFNVEGNPFAGATDGYCGFMEILRRTRPAQATLVPDGDDQLTSDHGWNLQRDGERVAPLIAELKSLGIRVSLFMDEDSSDWELARQVGADRVEIYTGPYAASWQGGDRTAALGRIRRAVDGALSAGLAVNAGHDLDLHNLGPLLTAAPQVAEVSIGHALISDAIYLGLEQTVRRYLAVIAASSGQI